MGDEDQMKLKKIYIGLTIINGKINDDDMELVNLFCAKALENIGEAIDEYNNVLKDREKNGL